MLPDQPRRRAHTRRVGFAATPLPLVFALTLTVGSDAVNRVSVGGTRLSAVLVAMGLWFSLASLPLLKKVSPASRWALAPMVLFLGYAVGRTVVAGRVGTDGLQNLAVVCLFVSLIVHAASTHDDGLRSAEGWLVTVAWVLSVVYVASVVLGGLGSAAFIGGRSFALQALVFMALLVPRFSHVPRARRLALLLFAAVAMSLSRTALVLAVVTLVACFAYRQPRGASAATRSRVRFAVGVFVAVALTSAAVVSVPVLRDRFFGGDRAQIVGGVTFNTEGRTVFWSTLSEGFASAPWFGHGAGTASERLGMQPHNDYLRVLHDYGIVGLALFLSALLRLLLACWRWFRTAAGRVSARRHAAAVCALVTWALSMLTDNALIYAFVLAPLAIVVGASLGQRDRDLRAHSLALPNQAMEPGSATVRSPSSISP